jgi:ABC-2 type transport system ATP-binding protein
MEDGVPVETQTMDPTAAVLDLSRRFDGEIPGLEVHRETLEDVYLALLQGDRYEQGGDSE